MATREARLLVDLSLACDLASVSGLEYRESKSRFTRRIQVDSRIDSRFTLARSELVTTCIMPNRTNA
jgi:hypothetical protein